MTDAPTFERFIKLRVGTALDKAVSDRWLATVRAEAPSGVVVSLPMLSDPQAEGGGQPQNVVLVHRTSNQGHSYLVPLARDLLDREVNKIVAAFAAGHADLDFDVETSQTFLKARDEQPISLDAQAHLALCLALAQAKHQNWLRERTDAGWRYGVTFDSRQRTHPLLRPWEQLPDRYRVPDLAWPQQLIGVLNDQGYAVVKRDELDRLLAALRRPDAKLNEAHRRKRTDQRGRTFVFWTNPGYSDVLALLGKFPAGLRGFVNSHHMLVWDAMMAVHIIIEDLLRDNGEWPSAGMVRLTIGVSDDDRDVDTIQNGEKGSPSWQADAAVAHFSPFQRAMSPPEQTKLK